MGRTLRLQCNERASAQRDAYPPATCPRQGVPKREESLVG